MRTISHVERFPFYCVLGSGFHILLAMNKESVALFLTMATSVCTNALLKLLVNRPRRYKCKSNTLIGGGKIEKKLNTLGMPSGHTHVAATFAFFVCFLLMNKTARLQSDTPVFSKRTLYKIVMLSLLCAVYLVGRQRIRSRCHVISEVAAGACSGAVNAMLGFLLYSKYIKQSHGCV